MGTPPVMVDQDLADVVALRDSENDARKDSGMGMDDDVES
jgi:hypothetical protein